MIVTKEWSVTYRDTSSGGTLRVRFGDKEATAKSYYDEKVQTKGRQGPVCLYCTTTTVQEELMEFWSPLKIKLG